MPSDKLVSRNLPGFSLLGTPADRTYVVQGSQQTQLPALKASTIRLMER